MGLRITIKPPDDVDAAQDAAKAFVQGFARLIIAQMREAERNQADELERPDDDVTVA
ncbi:MAG TPA: hypothetical protein VMK12_26120 [Anaeromyxobacteraceae bacterium]|nr:hypothetical protein [Anaeromyxobacteraceae bacterium]